MTPRETLRTDETSPLVGAHRRARHRASAESARPQIRDRRRRARSPRALVLAAVLGVVAGAGVTSSAAAYWTATGTAIGSATSGTVGAVTLKAAQTVGTLRPGGASTVTVIAENPNTTPVRIRALDLDRAAGTEGFTVQSGCDASTLGFVGATGPWTVPAASGSTPGSATLTLPGAVYLTQDAPNGCQATSVSVHLRELDAAPTYAARVAATAEVTRHWPLGAAGGVAATGQAATVSGAPAAVTDGVIDGATRFAGADGYDVASPLRGDMTVSAWFRASAGGGSGGPNAAWYSGAGIVDADQPNDQNDWGIALMADGRIEVGVGSVANSELRRLRSPTGLDDGTWHHVALTRARATGAVVLYLDGQRVAETTGATTNDMTSSVARIGGVRTPGGSGLRGDVDEVSLIGAALTSSQVATLYRAGVLKR